MGFAGVFGVYGGDLEGGSQESVASTGGIEVGVRGSRQGSGWSARDTPLAPPQGSSRIHLVDPEELRRILQKVSGFSEKGGFRWGFAECCARRGGFRRGLQESVFPRGGFRWGFADTCRVKGGI